MRSDFGPSYRWVLSYRDFGGWGPSSDVTANRDRGDSRLPSLTTVHAGPHTAVRRVELCVNSQAFCIVRRQVAIRSLPGHPLGLHPYLPPEGETILAFCRLSVPEIALLTCLSLYSPLRGTVRAFDHRSRLGLSIAPPFGIGVPH
jgi:hypothetical protein